MKNAENLEILNFENPPKIQFKTFFKFFLYHIIVIAYFIISKKKNDHILFFSAENRKTANISKTECHIIFKTANSESVIKNYLKSIEKTYWDRKLIFFCCTVLSHLI